MTMEELCKIPFNEVAHINGDTMSSVYKANSDLNLKMIVWCKRTQNGGYSKSRRYYMLDNKKYYKVGDLLDAINEKEK